MIKYKTKPNAHAIIYTKILEQELVDFLKSLIHQEEYRHLTVQPKLTLKEGEKPYEIISTASISIRKSYEIHNSIEDFIKAHNTELLSVLGSKECVSIELIISVREKSQTPQTRESSLTFIPIEPRYRFEQIILPDDLHREIYEALCIIDHQELIYKTWGFEEIDPIPKSILNFYGPPGTGKTMCAHAIAHKQKKKLLALNYAEIESKYVGDAPKNLMKAFETAKEMDAILFFDEADSFLGKRIQNVTQGAEQALNSLRSQMLILLEEFSGIVLFATNLVSNFDRAFESRILKHIKFELPNEKARIQIIKSLIPLRLPISNDFTDSEWEEIGKITDSLCGRELKSIVLETLLQKAHQDGKDAWFSFTDFKQAILNKQESLRKLKEETTEKKEKILTAIKRQNIMGKRPLEISIIDKSDLIKYHSGIEENIKQLSKRLNPNYFMKDLEFGVDSDGKVIVRGTEEYNRNSMIKVDGDKASAKAGSLEGAGSLNEFINETKLMPDTTYTIDDRQVCRTDHLGRVVSSKAELHKPIEGTRYQQRDTHTQARIIKDKDGILGHDDAGHLVPNRLGGPNEAINQIPMARELNRSGSLWFKTESELSNAVKDGKEVIVSDTLEYTGDSFRPDRINRTIIIDGSERVITFDNLPK